MNAEMRKILACQLCNYLILFDGHGLGYRKRRKWKMYLQEKKNEVFFKLNALILNRSSMHSINVNFFKYDKQVFR